MKGEVNENLEEKVNDPPHYHNQISAHEDIIVFDPTNYYDDSEGEGEYTGGFLGCMQFSLVDPVTPPPSHFEAITTTPHSSHFEAISPSTKGGKLNPVRSGKNTQKLGDNSSTPGSAALKRGDRSPRKMGDKNMSHTARTSHTQVVKAGQELSKGLDIQNVTAPAGNLNNISMTSGVQIPIKLKNGYKMGDTPPKKIFKFNN